MKKPLYRFFETSDGSPSVFFTNESGIEEAMHNRHGALAETDYIYGEGMRRALSLSQPVRVVSVGLGLGYVELMLAAIYLERLSMECATGSVKAEISSKVELADNQEKRPLEIVTFEKHDSLKQTFLAWLNDELEDGEWKAAYDRICFLIAEKYGQRAAHVKSFLAGLKINNLWRLSSSLEENLQDLPSEIHLFLYDAYSKKTSPELWQEALLMNVLDRAADQCLLCTYSSNGNLKRALKARGFRLENKPGFAGKRESTLAVKGDVGF